MLGCHCIEWYAKWVLFLIVCTCHMWLYVLCIPMYSTALIVIFTCFPQSLFSMYYTAKLCVLLLQLWTLCITDTCWYLTRCLYYWNPVFHISGCRYTHTHTRLTALCPGLPRWAGTRKVKPIWILLKQETVSGSGISWATCKSAPRFRQITTPAPHYSVFYRPDALPATQLTVSKHWRQHWM